MTKRSEEERSSRVRLRYHFKALTGAPELVLRELRKRRPREGRKTSTDPEEAVLILGYKRSLGNQSNTRVLPAQVTWFDRESLKGALTLTRSDSKEKDRL